MTNRKKIWLVILALIILSVLRESGCVNLNYSVSKFNDQMQINLYSEFYEYKGEKQQSSAERKNGNYETNLTDNSWNLGFHTTAQTNIFTDFEEQLQKNLADNEQVKVEIQEVELSGLCWLPLYKSGSCKYQFYVEVVGEKSRFYRGTARGKIDFSVSGISSVTEVKEKLSKQIAKIAIENVKKDAE